MKRREVPSMLLGTAAGALMLAKVTPAQACTATSVYDARAYGACGDGSTADDVSLQAWLDAIPSGGEGFLPVAPGGYYKLTQPLTCNKYISIRGEGRGSRIHYTGSATAMTLENCRFSTLANFLITGTSAANGGLYIKGGQEAVLLSQVFIEGFTRENAYALAISDSWDVNILGGAFRQSSFGVSCDTFNFNSGGIVNVLNMVGADCSSTGVGVGYQSGNLLNVLGCDFSSADEVVTRTAGIEIGADVGSSKFVGSANITGNWFEGGGAGVTVGRNNSSSSAPKDVEIRGNYFGNTGNHIRVYKSDRTRIGENQWGSGAVVIDSGVTNTTVNARGVTVTDNATAGQTGYYQYDQLVINDVIARNSLKVASGAAVTHLLAGSATIDFASVANGSQTSATVTVTGAALGDVVVGVSHSVAVPSGALLVGDVTSANTVTAKLINHTGAALDLSSGTVRAVVMRVT